MGHEEGKMKRQLGPVLAVLALFCAPLAWSQSDSADSGQLHRERFRLGRLRCELIEPGRAGGATTVGAPADPYFQVGSGDSRKAAQPFLQVGSADLLAKRFTARRQPNGSNGTTRQTRAAVHVQSPRAVAAAEHDQRSHPQHRLGLSLNTGSLNNYVKGGNGQQSYWQNIGMSAGGINFAQIRPPLLSSWATAVV